MKPEYIILVIIIGIFSALIVFAIIFNRPSTPVLSNQSNNNSSQAVVSDKDTINDLKSKVTWLLNNAQDLSSQLKNQSQTIQGLQAIASKSATTTSPVVVTSNTTGKTILATANTQGSTFTTTSATYTPMGMYVNINCPANCLLLINFYSSSKNIGSPNSSLGNFNIYDIFLDNNDQSIYSQASYPVDSSSIPVALNGSITAGVGNHTVDIRAKTTAGTLQSDVSSLQVMAVAR